MWRFFGFRASDVDQSEVVIKECHRVVSAPQGNTSNLFNHLKKHHKPKYDDCMKAKANAGPLNPRPCPAPTQTTIIATLHQATPYPSSSQRHAEITDAITFIWPKTCPINTVRNEGFKSMVKILDKKNVFLSFLCTLWLHSAMAYLFFWPLSWVHFILLFMIYYYFKFQFEALFTYGLFKRESAIKHKH